ncbi:Murinoglobulin-2 [Ophiophagus hannah]|uniref:Murinoglobulin-2 n=1 Tax=Ophiophagus hannah TaxID=8665 RepID=V8NK36_OPHHA|nr:Murinoglobulin-2 [Ophiophagus hannah]
METPENFCVQINNLKETLNLTLLVQDVILNQVTVKEKDVFQCLPFQIPRRSNISPPSIAILELTGKGLTQSFQNRKEVQIEKPKHLVFIQTDKPIYRAGQQVRFRIVSMDKDLHPRKEEDPKNNRVFQWTDVETPLGIIQLSYSLSSDPLLGTYKVVVEKDSTKVADYSFEVDEYVLPKFELLVKAPKLIMVVTKEIEVSVCGRYTYGKPVPGLVKLSLCRYPQIVPFQCTTDESLCKEFEGKADGDGCFSKVVNMEEFHLRWRGFSMAIAIEGKITEEGTDRYYKPGMPYVVQVKLVDSNEVPISNGTVEILMMATHQRLNQVTDAEGRAEFSIETTNTRSDVLSFMEFLLSMQIKAKGNIIRTGTHRQPVQQRKGKPSQLKRRQQLKFFSSWFFNDPFLIHLSQPVLVTLAKLWFSDQEGLPGQKAQLHLSAFPGSLCAVHAVDQSVFLLKPEAELSPEKVYNFLPKDHIVTADLFWGGFNIHPCHEGKSFWGEIIGIPQHYRRRDGDTYNIFRVSIKAMILHREIASELKPGVLPAPKEPAVAVRIDSLEFVSVPVADLDFDISGALPELPTPRVEAAPKRTPRHFFPETWIWDLVIINRKRDVSEEPKEIALPVTIPDTITEWKAGAFCLSPDTGFGLAQPTFLKAFQPFFTELTLPYSVVRISLTPSADFEASPMEEEEDSYCICAKGRKTVSWMMTPNILGKINLIASAEAVTSNQLCRNEVVEVPTIGNKDVVIKSLLVEPEGIEKEVVFNSLICTPGEPESKFFPLTLPENVVEGSARASFCVLGDILGGAIKNLNQLLKMPYGCGEQNMALFAPNIYILKYLNKTGQLTEEIKSKAIGYLEAGYQRQLNYKHHDGSYSAFGKPYLEEGNTWLTAFVLKCFAQARSIIFVEDKHINDAQNSLTRQQENDGCFRSAGSLFNNNLKGGVDDQSTLSTYITISLLEVPLPPTKVTEAEEIHIYLRALLAYAFALAGEEDKRQEMLDSLLKVAVEDDDGSIHWERSWKPKQRSDFPFSLRAPSAEIELNGYVLLALLTKKPSPSQEELTGYSSTQVCLLLINSQEDDTVVALQALSQYRTLTYSEDGIDARVTLSSGDAVLTQFHVDSNNSLLLQCHGLPQVPGNYKAEVTGCIFMQIALKYNVPLRQEDAPFRLDVHTVPETCTGNKAHVTFDIAMTVSYTGQRLVSNMAIVEIKMLSGYIPVKSSVKKLEKAGQIQKSEVNINRVLLYLDEVRNTSQTFSFTVEQETPVRGLKPALVKVYDYYETDDIKEVHI